MGGSSTWLHLARCSAAKGRYWRWTGGKGSYGRSSVISSFPSCKASYKGHKGDFVWESVCPRSIDPMVAAAAALAPTHTIKKTDNLCIWIDWSFFLSLFILLVFSVTKLLYTGRLGNKKKCYAVSLPFYIHARSCRNAVDGSIPTSTSIFHPQRWKSFMDWSC